MSCYAVDKVLNMNDMIAKAALEARRERYKPGTRIEIVRLEDPLTSLKPGDRGWTEFIDDTGTVFAKFDDGTSLGCLYGVDEIRKVTVMPDDAREQLLLIRSDGTCNMLDLTSVMLAAYANDFLCLVNFIQESRAAFVHFILTGETEHAG